MQRQGRWVEKGHAWPGGAGNSSASAKPGHLCTWRYLGARPSPYLSPSLGPPGLPAHCVLELLSTWSQLLSQHLGNPRDPFLLPGKPFLSTLSHFSWTKMCVRVGRAQKCGEGGSKLVWAQKPLEGLWKLSHLQHFTELQFRPWKRRGRDFPKAMQGEEEGTVETCPSSIQGLTTLPTLVPSWTLVSGPRPSTASQSSPHGPRRAWRTSCLAPTWLLAVHM